MKIAFICGKWNEELQQLKDCLVSRGHQVELLDLTQLDLAVFTDGRLGKYLNSFDLVYYRTGLGEAGRTMLNDLGVDKEKLVNPVLYKHALCSNKVFQTTQALRIGIKVPETYVGRQASYEQLSQNLGTPFILKAAHGIQGSGVFLIKSEEEYVESLNSIKGDVLYQKSIPNSGDYRVFVIGGEVYKIFKRVAPENAFKNNMSLGGRGEEVTDLSLIKELKSIALRVTEELSIEIGGIDIIQSTEDQTLYFLEANVNPGWRGLNATLGVDTAAAITDYFEQKVRGQL